LTPNEVLTGSPDGGPSSDPEKGRGELVALAHDQQPVFGSRFVADRAQRRAQTTTIGRLWGSLESSYWSNAPKTHLAGTSSSLTPASSRSH